MKLRVKVAFRFGIRPPTNIAMSNKLILLFDVDNTLLDNDGMTADL